MSMFRIRNKQDRRRPKPQIRGTVTAALARAAAFSPMEPLQKYVAELEEARKKGKGRQYRGQRADHESDASMRFSYIYNRSCYNRRRGR